MEKLSRNMSHSLSTSVKYYHLANRRQEAVASQTEEEQIKEDQIEEEEMEEEETEEEQIGEEQTDEEGQKRHLTTLFSVFMRSRAAFDAGASKLI